MISKDIYLANPCKTYSIPYSKMKDFNNVSNVLIFHYESISIDQLKTYQVQTFFRLKHDLKKLNPGVYKTEEINIEKDIDELIMMINECYQHEKIQVKHDDFIELTHKDTFDASLWLKIVENNKMVATIIGCIDTDLKEGWIEWVQVLPSFQGRGYGKSIINSLLYKMKDNADFVTVSGHMDNVKDPEKIYRKCGFTGNDLWYICKK